MKVASKSKVPAPLLPGTDASGQPVTLGVMGGGQLGRMFVHAAQAMGYATAVLDADADSPAGRVSHQHIQTGYTDAQGLAQLARVSAAITTEFENVPAAALQTLADQRPVAPAAAAVRIAQDRAAEKAHFQRCGVPCAPYAVIETPEQLQAVRSDLLPGILKTSRMGYDGKGQIRVKTRAALAAAWAELKGVPCVLEKMLALQAECSVIVARGRDGQCVHLPLQVNTHRAGILAMTEVYKGNVPPALAKRAVAAALSIASELQYVGVLCVEFFVLEAASPDHKALGRLIVNEIAPRPHNSGHYSQNACDVSQFELQVRTLAGLPLTAPRQHSPAIMLNLLGDVWPAGGSQSPLWHKLLALPGTHLHLYGKRDAKPGRKMGHLNITGATVAQVQATAAQAAKLLGIKAFTQLSAAPPKAAP
jgi:5-(carboxyamino)imidazole ribonucleotide synthase